MERQAFIDLCKSKRIKISADINGILFGMPSGEQTFELFEIGQLTCAFVGMFPRPR